MVPAAAGTHGRKRLHFARAQRATHASAVLVNRHLDLNVDHLHVLEGLVKAVCLDLLNHLHHIRPLHNLHTPQLLLG